MRILHVLDHSLPLQSGYASRTVSILSAQRSFGWETIQVTGPKQGEVAELEEVIDGWEFHRTRPRSGRLASLPGLGELLLMSDLRRRLDSVTREARPDVLHAHSPVLNAFPALSVGAQLGIPVVYEVRALWEDAAVEHGTTRPRGWRYRATRALETRALRRAAAITTICEGLRREIIARGIPEGRVTVIPNSVDLDRFPFARGRDEALASSLGLSDRHVVGFAGSFYSYEGLSLLVDALPEIQRSVPNTRILLVGGGPDEASLRRRFAAAGLADHVVWTGRVPPADVSRYLSLVDVAVFPRVRTRLNEIVTPLKPLEVMAQGRPVVASDVGGHRELIRHDETGLLFPAGDASALAYAVVGLLKAPERTRALVVAARRFVERERTAVVCARGYDRAYGVTGADSAA